MNRILRAMLAFALVLVGACATVPDTPSERQDLIADANAKLAEMQRHDPTLASLLDESAGYVIFPSVGAGGVIVGGAHGQGVLFVNDRPIGYVGLSQASIGAQLGGATFSELMVFETQAELDNLMTGEYSGGTQANATALSAGAAGSTSFNEGVATLVESEGGLMIDASFAGQRLSYYPMQTMQAK